MLLAIDVGNTSTVFGLFDGTELAEHWRVATERHKSGDELGALYRNFLDPARVAGIALSSTVPQPSYPFFHIKMEDVWVWDKNRPTRIIPRAEVYTSSDVTVEELRGEGDEPSLTAEALAERIGETLSTDDDV